MRRQLARLLKAPLKALAPVSVIIWMLSSCAIVFGGAGYLDHRGVSQGGQETYLLLSIIAVISLGLIGLLRLGEVLKRGEEAVDASVRRQEHQDKREAEALAGGVPGQLSIAREESAAEGDLSIAEQPGAVSVARRDPPVKN